MAVIPGLEGRVVDAHGRDEHVDVDLELSRQPFQRGVLGLGDLADPIFFAQEVHDLLVEDLKRGATRLADDGAPVLHVGVVAEGTGATSGVTTAGGR
jgi:hypothetical protein